MAINTLCQEKKKKPQWFEEGVNVNPLNIFKTGDHSDFTLGSQRPKE